METTINTFSEGMVSDMDKSIKSPNSYQYATNLRYLANINSNSGTLHSAESSGVIANAIESDFEIGEAIIGHGVIRDFLILFTSEYNASPSPVRIDRIRRYVINETTLSDHALLYEYNNLYSNDPSIFPEYLSVVTRYENSDNIKIYWANSDNSIRVANIAKYLTDTGLISGTYLDPSRLNIVTPVSSGSIVLSDMVSGSLASGKVNYSYNLLKENGQESNIINGLSGSFINLYTDNINTTSTALIKGDLEVNNTGKGVKLLLDIASEDYEYFDKIRLYRIHYKEYGQLPEISIVSDFNILQSGFNVLLDSGESTLGSLTSEEYAVLSSVAYSAYTIEEKDNVLFAGNVKETTFEIEFDARAYRFNSSNIANIYTSYGSYTTPEYAVTSGNWGTVAEDANCINAFNDLDNDITLTYRNIYQSDGSTIGGEGPEIEYYFSANTVSLEIDNSNTLSEPRTYSGVVNDAFFINNDYSSPISTYYLTGYQRDEIYRFGIIFYNASGIKSTVKWIGDIRIPGPESTNSDFYTVSDNSDIHPITVNFTLKNGLPAGATSYEIVRAPREENDRSIIDAGYVAVSIDHIDTKLKTRAPFVDPTSYDYSYEYITGSLPINYRILGLVSPESCFYEKTAAKAGDYLDVVGVLNNYIGTTEKHANNPSEAPYPASGEAMDDNHYVSIKYKDLVLNASGNVIDRYTLEEVQYIPASEVPTKYSFTQALGSVNNSAFITGDTTPGATSDFYSPSGRTTIVQVDSNLDVSAYTGFQLPYVYIKRNVLSRYSGPGYQERQYTKYISASKITDSIADTPALKGDIYINHFDYQNYMLSPEFDLALNPGGGLVPDRLCSGFVTYPVESKINISLRSDTDNFAKVYTNPSSYLIKDYAGLHLGSSSEYNQENDLYLYNSIYSQEDTISFSFSESDIDLRTEFDSRVVHSDKKFDDEYTDSWTKFRPNNFLDLESRYGPIKSLTKFNNVLYFAQDKAFGALSINQRSLISDLNPGTLSLGTGGTLSRFDYITENYGTQHKKSITSSKGGIYFFDKNLKSILNFNGQQLELLNESKGLNSYINNLTLNDIPFIEANSKNSEVYFQLSDNILVFNNTLQNFTSDYTINSDYICDINKYTIHYNTSVSTPTTNLFGLYLGNTYGSFNNGVSYNDSSLLITNNENFYNTKTYDNIIFYTDSRLNGIEMNTDTFDSVNFYNTYQYTGEHALTLGTTLKKLERGYSLIIPRNIVNANGTTNIDIFNVANQNPSRQFKERMRDKYIVADFTYENSATKGQISVPYISFLYRQSKR